MEIGNKGQVQPSTAVSAPVVAAPVVAVPVAVQAAPSEAPKTEMEMLLKLLIGREIRATETETQALESARRKAAHRAASAEGSDINTLQEQAKCPHRKGGKLLGAQIDHSLGMHTFIDGAQEINCHRCRAMWQPKDTLQFLYRTINGVEREIKNHTRFGWYEAFMAFSTQSTNKATSSEVILKTMDQRLADMVKAGYVITPPVAKVA
jgi:hypothetical protein